MSPNHKMLHFSGAIGRFVFVVLGPLAFMFALLAPPAALSQTKTAPLAAPQLEQLVAPIALYPDGLLSQVLMASTYPLEVVEAARWSRENPSVTGGALEEAMQKQSWDPSVKALTSVPQTLTMLNDKLSWTQQLGDAFLAQQEDVLAAVQRLRARADAEGYLKSSDKQKVTKVSAPQGTAPPPGSAGVPTGAAPSGAVSAAPIYTIEPVDPTQYAVPVYDPAVVYGTWPYPEYPPFYWTPPAYAGYGPYGLAAAALTGAAIWGGVDWWRNRVNVDVNNFNRFNRANIANGNWAHNPAHRGNVPYRDSATAQRFGSQSKAAARDAFRGKADAGRQNLAGQGDARAKAGATKSAGSPGRTAGAKQAGQANRAATAKQSGQDKQAVRAQQGGKGKQAAASKKSASQHAAGRTQQAGRSKQAARASAPRPGPGAGARTAAPRSPPAARGGMQRANVNLARGGGMRAAGMGGGMRAGGRGGGRRR